MNDLGFGPPPPTAPPFDYPITFVRSNRQKDIHAFVPETFPWFLIQDLAANFSIQQQVKVYRDAPNGKYRLCPMPDDAIADTSGYGQLVLTCDASEAKAVTTGGTPPEAKLDGPENPREKPEKHIPRPPNSWILFRQSKSKELSRTNPGATASELSTMISKLWREATPDIRDFWHKRAKEEDRLHKEMYPGYKFTTKKTLKS